MTVVKEMYYLYDYLDAMQTHNLLLPSSSEINAKARPSCTRGKNLPGKC